MSALKPPGKTWERRRALRWGSEHMSWHETEIVATNHAWTDIEAHGDEGRITLVDREKRIVYYDVHPKMA
jgi:hypothetical protein